MQVPHHNRRTFIYSVDGETQATLILMKSQKNVCNQVELETPFVWGFFLRMTVLVGVGLVLTSSCFGFWQRAKTIDFIDGNNPFFYLLSILFTYILKTVTTWCSHADSVVLNLPRGKRQSLEAWCCVIQASRQPQPRELSHTCAYCNLVGTLFKIVL